MNQRLQMIIATVAITIPINLWIASNYGAQPIISIGVTIVVSFLVVTLWYHLSRSGK